MKEEKSVKNEIKEKDTNEIKIHESIKKEEDIRAESRTKNVYIEKEKEPEKQFYILDENKRLQMVEKDVYVEKLKSFEVKNGGHKTDYIIMEGDKENKSKLETVNILADKIQTLKTDILENKDEKIIEDLRKKDQIIISKNKEKEDKSSKLHIEDKNQKLLVINNEDLKKSVVLKRDIKKKSDVDKNEYLKEENKKNRHATIDNFDIQYQTSYSVPKKEKMLVEKLAKPGFAIAGIKTKQILNGRAPMDLGKAV